MRVNARRRASLAGRSSTVDAAEIATKSCRHSENRMTNACTKNRSRSPAGTDRCLVYVLSNARSSRVGLGDVLDVFDGSSDTPTELLRDAPVVSRGTLDGGEPCTTPGDWCNRTYRFCPGFPNAFSQLDCTCRRSPVVLLRTLAVLRCRCARRLGVVAVRASSRGAIVAVARTGAMGKAHVHRGSATGLAG